MPLAKLNKALFVDRDGTLNQDVGYLHSPDQVVLLPGTSKGLALFKEAGWLLVVVSNQSGVGRGYITREQVIQVNDRIQLLLSQDGVTLDRFYCCYHAPWEGCECRKPQAGLLRKAASELSIDLSRSYLLGDKTSDTQAASTAGVKGFLISSDESSGNTFRTIEEFWCHVQQKELLR